MVHQVAAHRSKELDIDSARHKLEAEAKELTIQVLQDWQGVDSKDIKVSEISGGITNLLWLLRPADQYGLEPAVLRVFGKQTDKIIDRQKEGKILPTLNAAGFGAQVLATFENGRIEAYLPMRALKPQEMVTKNMSKRIAKRLKQFHSVEEIDAPSKPQLFETISDWLKAAKDLVFDDEQDKAKAHAGIDFDSWTREFHEVREAINSVAPAVTLTHNDLLAGNVLVPNQESEGEDRAQGELQFIDFEYSDTTYRMYDIANHFCEYAGFECDYSRFPDPSHAEFFVREYLEEGNGAKVDAAEVRRATAESFMFALVAHQYWGTWAILQAKYSPIEFDYMEYGQKRWAEYFKRKAGFLQTAQHLLSS